jgi:uncharacterized protein YecE (DUF72 family)
MSTVAPSPHDPGPQVAAARAAALARAAVDPIEINGGTVRVGTASWTDPTMTVPGVFYPQGVDDPEARLAYYAAQFPVVEVDATYYALPAARTSRLWVERTPPDFVFDVKAHALMTGQPSEPRRLPRDLRAALPAELAKKGRIYAEDLPSELQEAIWDAFVAGIAPLAEAGQLGAVFLQYPPWFYASSAHRETVLAGVERLRRAGLTAAVEFRHASWFTPTHVERTLQFLEEHRIPLVMVDAPQGFSSSIPPIVATPSPELAVVRFHGRRRETWQARGIPTVEKFRYLYDRAELAEWVPRIRQAARAVRETHVLMNNCYANYGATNARELAALLAGQLSLAEATAGNPR